MQKKQWFFFFLVFFFCNTHTAKALTTTTKKKQKKTFPRPRPGWDKIMETDILSGHGNNLSGRTHK